MLHSENYSKDILDLNTKLLEKKVEELSKYNEELLSQLSWILEKVLIKDGKVSMPNFPISSRDIIESLKELEELANK